MDYITSTQIRTQSTKFIDALKRGDKLTLIHRSKIIGDIILEPNIEPIPFDPEEFEKFAKKLNLPKTTYKERERNYRTHLMKKYGKGLS